MDRRDRDDDSRDPEDGDRPRSDSEDGWERPTEGRRRDRERRPDRDAGRRPDRDEPRYRRSGRDRPGEGDRQSDRDESGSRGWSRPEEGRRHPGREREAERTPPRDDRPPGRAERRDDRREPRPRERDDERRPERTPGDGRPGEREYGFGVWARAPGMRIATPWKAVALSFGLAVGGFVAAFFVANLASLVIDFDSLSPVLQVVVGLSLLQGTAFPLVAILYVKWRGISFDFLRVRRPSLRDLGVAVGGFVLAFLLVNVALSVVVTTGTETAQRADRQALQNPDVLMALIPLAILVIGPGEELLFRGVIQGTLREVFSAPMAIVIASATFAPAHILALQGGLSALAVTIGVLFLPSLVFGAVYEYTENLLVPSLSHGLYNATLFSIALVASGG